MIRLDITSPYAGNRANPMFAARRGYEGDLARSNEVVRS